MENIEENGMTTTIIVEIPHELPPSAWIAYKDADIIAGAGSNFIYTHWTFQEAFDCWSEEDEIPEDLLKILKEEGKAVEIGDTTQIEYCSAKNCPSILDAAKEAIAFDLSRCHFLTIEQAKNYKNTCSGHYSIKAAHAVEKVLKDLGV